MANFYAHFPANYSKDIRKFADQVMSWSRYLFTRRVGGIQFGYCSNCRKEYMTESVEKHNTFTVCKKCKSQVFVKASGRGRKQMYDRAYFVYYEKSLIDPAGIIARGIYIARDFTGDYYKTETKFETTALYLFKPGEKSKMYTRHYWGTGWSERASITAERLTSMKYVRCYYSRESIAAAVKGTPFQYCTWEQYEEEDMLTFFELAAKYPCVEYLTKIGLRGIVSAKINGQQTYGVINWRGKTLQKVLKLNTNELKQLRITGPYGPKALWYYHKSKKENAGFSLPEARIMCDIGEGYYLDELNKLVGLAPLNRIRKYFLKQLDRIDQRHYRTASGIFIGWRDYIKDCRELGMDVGQEHVLFPNDLYSAHQKTIEKVKLKQDKALNAKLTARLKGLQEYRFELNGLFIRPAASTKELFDEGKALNHCVGGYSRNYAEGKTNLFVIRTAAEPDKPFYTMEVIDHKIIQVRGLKNCDPTEEVQAFIQAFTAAKLVKKSKRSKVKIAQPA